MVEVKPQVLKTFGSAETLELDKIKQWFRQIQD